ncbi:homoserine O-succinyltransferase MetA [Janthinobacterium sp. HH01]|uniref:homoserine O-acetyltransferase/O-succinyltransferase family protein n=1 Tax=Janthinobacterium sp. HH01 TaxID=1198452 RepID=UPI0002AECE23|nr:homoserine O-succinyltransferase [Janthinobacterium sp. HH01]ELX11418.1 homoserine O-succinyltransferase MetA [Janthinobacterium sp. HH01]
MTTATKPRVAIINLMPQAEVYFDYMARALPPGTEVSWVRVRKHPYRSSNQDILAATHRYYDMTDIDACDAVLLTGAAMDLNPDFTAAAYWDEVVGTLRDASTRVGSIAGVCWGAQVLAKVFYDIDKRHFPAKLSGVFEMHNLRPEHPLMRGLDDRYWLPQSRYAEMEPAGFAAAVAAGKLVPLDWSEASGHTTVVSDDGGLLMLQGHQDYPTERLMQEYRNAQQRGEDPPVPLNYDPERPLNRWGANSRALLAAWLQLAMERKRALRAAQGANAGLARGVDRYVR